MKAAALAFTEKGFALAKKITDTLGGEASRSGDPLPLRAWTARHFPEEDALIFVGAAGIAVRAIAPYVKSKTTDPAVVVLDECGEFVIPILSGHLGGANDLAREIAAFTGAVPVITTATDRNGVFAVDEWAKRQPCHVKNPGRIRFVSGALLAGKSIRVKSAYPISGEAPAGVIVTDSEPCDVVVDLRADRTDALCLIPQIAVLGVGCRKGTPREAIEAALDEFLSRTGIDRSAITAVASIDLKRDEAGLCEFCRAHGWPFLTYSAEALAAVEGDFTPSAFVRQITGVDNVCERSAVLASGGTLIEQKAAANGVTMALAVRPFTPDWRKAE